MAQNEEAGLQDSQGGRAVLDLGLLILHGHDDARRDVGHTHGRVGRVHGLTTGARGAEDVDLQLRLGNLDVVRRLDQRNDLDGSERRLAAALVIEGADTHEAVGAGLDAQRAVGIGGLDLEGRRLQAGFFSVGRIHDLRRVAVTLRPTQVHAQEDLGEVGGIHAARAASDRNDGIALVVLAVQQRADLQVTQVLAELLQISLGLGQDVGALVRVLGGHVHHGLQVVDALAHLRDAIELALAVAERARDSLGGARVVPQVGRGRLLIQLGDLRAQLVRLHDREDVLHGGAQGRDLFRKFNGHPSRVADRAANEECYGAVVAGLTPPPAAETTVPRRQ